MIDIEKLLISHPNWPTNYHKPEFWEYLGRAVASLGLLEETLKKSIYIISGNKRISNLDNSDDEYNKWIKDLEKVASNAMGSLIKKLEGSINENHDFVFPELNNFIEKLERLLEWRNILCHGSWRPPDSEHKSQPLFIRRDLNCVQNTVDVDLLKKVIREAAESTCFLINIITTHGLEFPGLVRSEVK